MTSAKKHGIVAVLLLLILGATAWVALRDSGTASIDPSTSATEVPGGSGDSKKQTPKRQAQLRGGAKVADESIEDRPPIDFATLDRDLDLCGTVVDPKGAGISGA